MVGRTGLEPATSAVTVIRVEACNELNIVSRLESGPATRAGPQILTGANLANAWRCATLARQDRAEH
jgi:hypothetical protein